VSTQVTQAVEADDRDLGARSGAEALERGVGGDAGAKQRCRPTGLDPGFWTRVMRLVSA
jgi:hypothetical protein